MYGYYNNFYNQSYQPQAQDERIWVQNQTSAEAYLVAPNGFVRLWDANAPRFYEKKADASGRPYPLEAYEYSKIAPVSASKSADDTINTNDIISGLTRRIEALEEAINNAECFTNDTTVQSVQGELSGKPKGRGRKASSTGEDIAEPA